MSETILLTEDEPALRTMIRCLLQAAGYNVLEAPDAAEVVRLCDEHPGPIHLLVSDVVMPDMNGCDLAAIARRLRPGIKVLLISGHMPDVLERRGVHETSAGFLRKPFRPDFFCHTVSALLQDHPAEMQLAAAAGG